MADDAAPVSPSLPATPWPVASSAEDPVDLAQELEPPESPVASPSPKPDAAGDQDTPGDDNDESRRAAWEEKRRQELVADWKALDFDHFKNRYGPDEGHEIIEVLKGHPHLEQEIWRVTYNRNPRGKSTRGDRWRQKSKAYSKDTETDYIQRIRIQSPALLLLLSRLSGIQDTWPTHKPRVFFRPFRAQYYHQPRMKQILAILERRFGKPQTNAAAAAAAAANAKVAPTDGVDGALAPEDDSRSDAGSVDSDDPQELDLEEILTGDVANTVTALQHVRKYVEFVDEQIIPVWEKAQETSKRKVAFLDLWRSFRPGEILYRPPNADSLQGRETSSQPASKAHQCAWRLYGVSLDSYADYSPNDFRAKKDRDLDVYCYYIDYDGLSYLPVRWTFSIKDYDGEKDITQLPIYPLRFAKDSEKLLESFREQGRRFQAVKTKRHFFYDGWTLTHGPNTDAEDRSKRLNSEHIDSNVIVDFLEGYKAESSLSSPTFNGLSTFNDDDWPEGTDSMEIWHWKNDDHHLLDMDVQEVTQRNEWFGAYLASRHKKTNRFMRDWLSGRGVTELHGDDLALLPRRVVAFAFRERKFILADIQSLQDIPKQEDVIQNLKIDPKHKQMIESLVETHFEKQAMQKEFGALNLNQDLFRGKGAGLFLLLHGVPGVGKTATAEAIAQVNTKPLFTITCGDLGFEPGKVDESLRNIFRLAHLWDCVLLLDEADVFLSRREVYDLNRNALVSGRQPATVQTASGNSRWLTSHPQSSCAYSNTTLAYYF